MCRNIHTLHNFEPAAIERRDQRGRCLQYVRKIAGTTKPSKANQEAFDRAVHEIAHITGHLLQDLVAVDPAEESAKRRPRRPAPARSRRAGTRRPERLR